jgi:hypothetical protein
MKIVDVADECYRELLTPDDISIPNIAFWLENNLKQLNILIGTSYVLNESTHEANPELGDSEASILKYLYMIYYYDRLVRSSLGAAQFGFSELSDGDTTIRWVSKNEIAKTYVSLKSALENRLNRMLNYYRNDAVIPQSLSAAHDLIRFYRI